MIDSYNGLVKQYKREKDIRRQKIVSKINSNAKEYIPTMVGNAKENRQLPAVKIRVENSATRIEQRNDNREWKENYIKRNCK